MSKTSKTVTIKLPEEIFGPDATAERRSPLRVRHVRRIGVLQQDRSPETFDLLSDELAQVWPAWNILDPETGEPLPQPQDDPAVFMELEVDQFQYFGGKGLTERPT